MASESSRGRRERAEQMRKEKERQDKRRRTLITAAVVAAVLVVIAGAGFAVKSVMDDSAGDEVRTPKGLTKDGGVMVTAEDLGGTAQPDPVKVTIFEDLQCPVCKAFEETSGGWVDEQVAAGAIEVEYRPVAFLNEFSAAALAASMCVFEDAGAKGWVDYTRTVYQNQPDESSTDVDEDHPVMRDAYLAASRSAESMVRDRWAAFAQTNELIMVDLTGLRTVLAASPIRLSSMGRGLDADPGYFLAAAAAGRLATTLLNS